MLQAIVAGAVYCGVVFAAGFALGTSRVLIVAPLVGETAAVALELPVMLIVSWAVCRWLIRRFAVPADLVARMAMGGVAFAILMAAEIGVSVLVFGRTLIAHLAQYRGWPALLGLAGQLAFAAFPLADAILGRRRGSRSEAGS